MNAIHDKPNCLNSAKKEGFSGQDSRNFLPTGPISIFHEYCTIEECFKLSLTGKVLSSKIITKSINTANKVEIANFVASVRKKHESSDFMNFQKMIDLFFKHASTEAQARFFSFMIPQDNEFLSDIIMEIPINTAHLNLTNCKWLRDHHVESIVGRLNNLSSLNFSNCCSLTDRSIAAIVGPNTARMQSLCVGGTHMANLKSLNFMRCHRLTNASPTMIGNSPNMTNLQSIKFAWCRHVTDLGAAAISNSPFMTRLRTVNLRGCTVTAAARAAITNRLKQNASNKSPK